MCEHIEFNPEEMDKLKKALEEKEMNLTKQSFQVYWLKKDKARI